MSGYQAPSEATRQAISDAVHTAVVERLEQIPGRPYDPRAFCWLYAAVGARVASEFVGAGYAMEAGRIDFSLAGSPPLLEGAGAAIGHHAWIVRDFEGSRVEVADLASRHYPFWFAQIGLTLPTEIVTGLVWSRPADLPPGLLLLAHREAAAAINAFQAMIGRIVEEAADIARARLFSLGMKPIAR